MNKQDGIEGRALEFYFEEVETRINGVDEDVVTLMTNFARTETATITAQRDRLKEAMLELVDKAERLVGFCLYCDMDGLENASEPERTMLAPALAKAKALIDDNGDA